MTAADLERIMRLIALLQQGAAEVGTMIAQIRRQQGETTDQILADAEVKNAEAKTLIDTL